MQFIQNKELNEFIAYDFTHLSTGEGAAAISVAVSPDKRHFVSLSNKDFWLYSIKVN